MNLVSCYSPTLLPPFWFNLLSISPDTSNFYVAQWKGEVRLPDITLEDSEEYLEGQNKVMFLRFMRKMLQWDPDKRQNARELLEDPWLNSY